MLCVDEKSRIQALERTQPMLPMGLGYVKGVTQDYLRHGATTSDSILARVDRLSELISGKAHWFAGEYMFYSKFL